MNRAFSKIWTIITILILAGGGILAWRYIEWDGIVFTIIFLLLGLLFGFIYSWEKISKSTFRCLKCGHLQTPFIFKPTLATISAQAYFPAYYLFLFFILPVFGGRIYFRCSNCKSFSWLLIEKNRKGILISGLVFFISLLSLLFLLFWGYFQIVNEGPKTLEESREDKNVNLVTYRNEKLGFEIKYPNDWKMRSEFPGRLGPSQTEFLEGVSPQSFIFASDIITGEGNVTLYVAPVGYDCSGYENLSSDSVSVFLKQNITKDEIEFCKSNIYFRFSLVAPQKDIFNQILSTFRFIEAQPTGQLIIQKCADETLHGQCSTTKPKYCEDGNLVNKASLCGCPSGYKISNNENECEKIVSVPLQNADTFIKDIFGDKVNLIASENPSIFLGNDIGQHLFDTSWTNCQSMINKVNELTLGKSTNYEKAKSIINWLANSRQYSEPSPLTAGKNMCESFSVNYGICHDSAYLGVAMLRLANIPSRVLGPVKGASHNYVEFYSDGKWYGIDGTFCQPCGGERFALERSALLNVFQTQMFDQTKELTSVEGWRGNYTDRTFSYSVKSIILITASKKNLLAENEKIEWGELTYPNPFYEISNSRITGAKVVAKDLYCNVYECGQSQGANQEIYLPSGGNILVAGDRITYEKGQKKEELKDGIFDQPFLFEDFYITTTLPFGQYRFWYGNIAFADIKINPGEKIEIKPDILVKPSNITQKEFDNFIAYLKTIK